MSYTTSYNLVDIIKDNGSMMPVSIADITFPEELYNKVGNSLAKELHGSDSELSNFYDIYDVVVECWDKDREEVIRGFLAVSELYPDLTFDIEGHGEEWGDWFVARFQNGSMALNMLLYHRITILILIMIKPICVFNIDFFLNI